MLFRHIGVLFVIYFLNSHSHALEFQIALMTTSKCQVPERSDPTAEVKSSVQLIEYRGRLTTKLCRLCSVQNVMGYKTNMMRYKFSMTRLGWQ